MGIDAATEIQAINALNKLSADGELELLIENYPDLLDGIADSLDRHNSHLLRLLKGRLLRHQHLPSDKVDGSGSSAACAAAPTVTPMSSSTNSGNKGASGDPPTRTSSSTGHAHPRHQLDLPPPWLDPSERRLLVQDPGPVVLGLLSILRNLSYIVANEDAIAYHTRILAHLISLLPCNGGSAASHGQAQQSHNSNKKSSLSGTDTSSGGGVGVYVTDIIMAVSKNLDVNGIPLSDEDVLAAGGVPEDSLMALAPPKLRAQCAPQTQDPVHQEFISLVTNVFPILIELVGEEDDRGCVLRSLECLTRLLAIEDNAHLVAKHASPQFLTRLHELLYVPSQGPDSLGGGTGRIPVGRQHQLPERYSVIDGHIDSRTLDVELRNWSLEILSLLCPFHEVHAKIFELVPGLPRSLIFLLRREADGAAAGDRLGTHPPRLAARILTTLASAGGEGGGRAEMTSLRPLLTHYAFRPGGELAAQVLYAAFLAPAPSEEDEENEGEEENDDDFEGMSK